jgi:hypothetical protein
VFVVMSYQSPSLPVGFSLETHRRAAVAVWWPVMIAAAAGVAWSLALMLVAREPDAPPVARKPDRDAVLVRNTDDLIPKVNAPPVAARWVPLVPAGEIDGGNEGLPSIDGPSLPSSPPSSPAREPVRAETTPHRHPRARHPRDVCAAHGMRRKNFYHHNWRSWRCV